MERNITKTDVPVRAFHSARRKHPAGPSKSASAIVTAIQRAIRMFPRMTAERRSGGTLERPKASANRGRAPNRTARFLNGDRTPVRAGTAPPGTVSGSVLGPTTRENAQVLGTRRENTGTPGLAG